MIRISKVFNKPLTSLMVFLLIHISLLPLQQLVHAETPNPLPPQQRSNLSPLRQTFKAGDAVQIIVFPDTSSFLNNTFPIDGNGNIFLPIVGKTKIDNMSETEFIQFLSDNFTQYLRSPQIQVRPLIRTSLLGGFARPSLYYIDPNQTVWDLVHLAGGTIAEDGLKKMKWSRDNKTIESNLIPYYQSNKSLYQLGFRSGDQIWTPIPTERVSFWEGFVRYFIPIAGLGVTAFTIWYTTQLSYSYRR